MSDLNPWNSTCSTVLFCSQSFTSLPSWLHLPRTAQIVLLVLISHEASLLCGFFFPRQTQILCYHRKCQTPSYQIFPDLSQAHTFWVMFNRETNAVSANSPLTDTFQRKMTAFTWVILFRGIRSCSGRSVLYYCFSPFLFHSHAVAKMFFWQKGMPTATALMAERLFFEKQDLPTHFLTQDHLLQHLHIFAFEFYYPRLAHLPHCLYKLS